jgi:paraquat-inducible protein B
VLHAQRRGSLQPGSPIYYHGIEVGVVENVQLSNDAQQLDIPIFIRHRYAPLVRTDSVFWTVGGADIQGGILTGVRVRVESLRSLFAGGIAFATPTTKFGPPADAGTEFSLEDEAKRDWLTWSPVIALPPTSADETASNP